MARLPRFFVEDQRQHIIQRDNIKQVVFVATQNYHRYLNCLTKSSDDLGFQVAAHVSRALGSALSCGQTGEDGVEKKVGFPVSATDFRSISW